MRLKIVLQAYIFNNNNNNQNPFNMDILILCFICLNKGLIFNHSKKCAFCKGLHNSAICHNKDDRKQSTESKNVNLWSSEKDFVLLQTTEVNLKILLKER